MPRFRPIRKPQFLSKGHAVLKRKADVDVAWSSLTCFSTQYQGATRHGQRKEPSGTVPRNSLGHLFRGEKIRTFPRGFVFDGVRPPLISDTFVVFGRVSDAIVEFTVTPITRCAYCAT